jgi:hypothetical protein
MAHPQTCGFFRQDAGSTDPPSQFAMRNPPA